MTTQADLDAVVGALREHDRFLVTSHENPDGDALGSLLAMHLALVQLGKDSVMVLTGDTALPGEYRFLGLAERGLVREAPADRGDRVAVAVDCTSAMRRSCITGSIRSAIARRLIAPLPSPPPGFRANTASAASAVCGRRRAPTCSSRRCARCCRNIPITRRSSSARSMIAVSPSGCGGEPSRTAEDTDIADDIDLVPTRSATHYPRSRRLESSPRRGQGE